MDNHEMMDDNDFFENNLNLLQEHHPNVWQAINKYQGSPLGELHLAADGNPNLVVRTASGEEIFLHDSQDTESELAGYYALVPEHTPGVAVFVGMGLGYTPPAMLASRKHLSHIVVLEPEIGIFVQALHARDLTPFLTDRLVTIAIGPNINVPAILAPMARSLQLEALYILTHTPCFKLFPDTYHAMHDEIYAQGNTYNISGATSMVFGNKFIDNRLKHLSTIHHHQLLEHLKDSFAGVPAIMVSGGPSLDKNIHLLAQAKGKAVIIAVDSALPALLAHGVTPDFTTSIDMEDVTIEKIIDTAPAATETSLVCASWVTSLVPKNFPARQVYWTFTAKNMEKWVNNLLGGKVLTTGAGTVAQLSFITAYLLGCSPIIFVGQDLAFSEQADHAKHTPLTVRDQTKNFLAGQDVMWVDGYGGEVKVPTTRAWLGNKNHLEQSMASAKDRQFINATEGGVRLEGTEELPLHEALARYCSQVVDVAAKIRETEEQTAMPDRRRMINEFTRTIKTITVAEQEISRLEKLITKIAQELIELQKQGFSGQKFASLPHVLQRQIKEMDALNASLDKSKLWSLLDEATMEGLRQSDRLKQQIDQLAGEPEHYFQWLQKSFDRFAVINHFRRQVLPPFSQRLRQVHNHLQREAFLLKKIAKAPKKAAEDVLELLRLYYASGDYVLIERTIAAHCQDCADSAEISFYLGAIAAQRSQFEEMNSHFTRVVDCDTSWRQRIAECRERLAAQYLGFGLYWQSFDQSGGHRLLFKAARYTTEYLPLKQAIVAEADRILSLAEPMSDEKALQDVPEIVAAWSRELSANIDLGNIIQPTQGAAIHRLHGSALHDHEDFAAAAQAFAAALALTPQDPQLYLLLANADFARDEYATGIAALDRAVALDRCYAKSWEDIGDTLLAASQPADAALAYEKCFQALPEEVGLLRKIAECYLAAVSS